ncbi:formyltetrahydrofolate deformylase [Sneathiella glossodoripedis]|uniref:formyltetrahydrofolate deformylase n=1 Tax=Sneathiella glossodoripedis TaxID=418853 RepID=UPI000472466B|nr:formyltetrahydrofolate deformylase [Sneathiella glossodoripedis]
MTLPYTLTLSCINHPGIVADVASYLAKNGANIVEAAQFDDPETGRFFMRLAFNFLGDDHFDQIKNGFSDIANTHGMDYHLRSPKEKKRVLILVSKFDHCLVDLLYRYRTGELPMELVGVAGNHPIEVLNKVDLQGIPYTHLPISEETKSEQETRLKELITKNDVDLIILARYMQILSDDMSEFVSGRCINIHHSFLPGFKGAKPYHQAHERGVKLIGATAHFVTSDLDEGPIIEQDVERINHFDSPDDLIKKGRDIERRVLARAISYYLEDRVLLNGSKTVVFSR